MKQKDIFKPLVQENPINMWGHNVQLDCGYKLVRMRLQVCYNIYIKIRIVLNHAEDLLKAMSSFMAILTNRRI